MRTLDKLLEDPRAIVAKLVHADPQSFVPVAYQSIGPYVINDAGVHLLFPDAENELAVDTIYPVGFRATQGDGCVLLHWFTPSGEIESTVHLSSQTDEAFHSLDDDAKAKIDRFISYCLLRGVV